MKRRNKRKILHNLKIEGMAAGGKGIAREEGKVVFVEGAIPGDVVDAQLRKSKKDYAIGVPVKLHQASPERAEPFCIHFDYCGGCKWQHLQYEHQLKYKQQVVVEAFERIGKMQVPQVLPILGSTKQRFYRNKLEYTFSNKKWLTPEVIASGEVVDNRDALGFHIPGAFDKVLDIEECWLMGDSNNAIRLAVREFAKANNYTFFDLREQQGLLRNLIIRITTTGEVMVVLSFHENDEEKIKHLLDFLLKTFPGITSLQYVINPKRNDTIFDLQVKVFHGKDHIVEQLGQFKYKIGPKSFFQTNSYQTEQLYNQVVKFAGPTGEETVYDLYTGIGTIAIFISQFAKKVIGVEQIPEAIEDARENAEINNVTNTEFFAADTRDILSPEFFATHGQPDVIVTDPPRAGMHPDVVEAILHSGAKKVVYVSCNPSTQARDVQLLQEKYELKLIQPVDMFPHTFHVENVALLELKT